MNWVQVVALLASTGSLVLSVATIRLARRTRRSLVAVKKHLPSRRLIDWTPDQGDQTEWLAQLDADGWQPEHRTGAEVVVNGRRVVRFAMIERAAGES